MKRKIFSLIFFYFIFCLLIADGLCQSAVFHSKIFGFNIGSQFTFDFYKPYASIYMDMKRRQTPIAIQPGGEQEIYINLGTRLFLPRYLLFQATGYPLSALSSYLETDHFQYYNRFNIFNDINLLRSVGAGFEEPYALSLFLGNILFLAYSDSSQRTIKQSGSALAGFIISIGRHQIHNNIYLHDNWYQVELMLVGNLNEPQKRRISWNFRVGAKFHQTNFFWDVMTCSIERNHTDRFHTGWSLIKNSVIKYQIQFPLSFVDVTKPATFQLITYGKKFPLTLFERKAFFILGFGIRWEMVKFYDHKLNQFNPDPERQLIWLIQPNIEF